MEEKYSVQFDPKIFCLLAAQISKNNCFLISSLLVVAAD